MARGGTLEAGNLAAQADMAEALLHRPLEQGREFRNAERRQIVPLPLLR